jgi:hypothetical protein
VLFLAHEFHHTCVGRAEEAGLGSVSLPENADDRALRAAIAALRSEGIAALVD